MHVLRESHRHKYCSPAINPTDGSVSLIRRLRYKKSLCLTRRAGLTFQNILAQMIEFHTDSTDFTESTSLTPVLADFVADAK